MTIKAYLTSKFQPLGITLSDADFFDIQLRVGDLEAEMTVDNRNAVFEALAVTVIPQLMLRHDSISENGFSVSFNKEGVLKFHSWLCGQLGIKDTLNKRPTVRNLTV